MSHGCKQGLKECKQGRKAPSTKSASKEARGSIGSVERHRGTHKSKVWGRARGWWQARPQREKKHVNMSCAKKLVHLGCCVCQAAKEVEGVRGTRKGCTARTRCGSKSYVGSSALGCGRAWMTVCQGSAGDFEESIAG